MKIVFLLFILLFIQFPSDIVENKSFISAQKITVVIQPFNDLPETYLTYITTDFKKVFTDIEIKKAIPFPKTALNYNKTRCRADSLIRYLGSNTEFGKVTIGLTTKDISTTKGKYNDWGVMGLGYCPGNACIASSFRLNKDKKLVQLYKVAIHELGHTQGLPHCPVKSCFMRDAEGKNHTDEEVEFCSSCKTKLVKAGWVLK